MINNKLNRIENFESDLELFIYTEQSQNYLEFKNLKCQMTIKSITLMEKLGHLKIPRINSNNFVLTFKFKSSKKNNFLLSGSYGELSVKITDDNLI